MLKCNVNKKVLITGAAGFLGSNLIEKLIENNFEVIAVDQKQINPHYLAKVKFFHMSIETFLNQHLEVLNDITYIIHAASVLPYKGKKHEIESTNVNSTKLLVDEVSKRNLFFTYISSSGIYGVPYDIPVSPETKFNPLDTYGKSKIKAENYILKTLDFKNYAIVRPRTILGNKRGGIFNIFFKLIKKNIPIPLPNSGKQIIQFVHVDDVSNLIVYLIKNKIYGVWPAASPNPLSLNEYLNELADILNKKKILKLNLNTRLFEYIGKFILFSKVTSFTKWHFGSFPHDFYFDEKWKPQGFHYKKTSSFSFLECASETFKEVEFDLKNHVL